MPGVWSCGFTVATNTTSPARVHVCPNRSQNMENKQRNGHKMTKKKINIRDIPNDDPDLKEMMSSLFMSAAFLLTDPKTLRDHPLGADYLHQAWEAAVRYDDKRKMAFQAFIHRAAMRLLNGQGYPFREALNIRGQIYREAQGISDRALKRRTADLRKAARDMKAAAVTPEMKMDYALRMLDAENEIKGFRAP